MGDVKEKNQIALKKQSAYFKLILQPKKIMEQLPDQELYAALMYARNINEIDGQEIMQNFHHEQPVLAETLFTLFPSIIAEKNQDLSFLFMELCFDILCVFQHAFGKAPVQSDAWLAQQMKALESELISLKSTKNGINTASTNVIQTKLLQVFKEAIDDYASENPASTSYTTMTQSMITASIQLIEKLYQHRSTTLH